MQGAATTTDYKAAAQIGGGARAEQSPQAGWCCCQLVLAIQLQSILTV